MERRFIEWAEATLNDRVTVRKENHGNQSIVLRLQCSRGDCIIKIGARLEKERDRLAWLRARVPVPEVIAFTHIGGHEALLLTLVPGTDLKVLSKRWPPTKVVETLASALGRFHATEISDWPFGAGEAKQVLVHGDACLPNLMFDGDSLSGYVDVGDSAVDEPETDLAAAIWTLQHNLGSGYGRMFLAAYGMQGATEEFVEQLRLRYEVTLATWRQGREGN